MSDADVPQRTVTPVVPQSVVSTQRAISRQGDIPSRASVRARPVVPSQPPVTTRVPTQVATASRVVASTPAMRVPTTGTARYAQASLPVYQAPAAGTVVVPQRVLVVTDPRGLANGRVQRAVARAVSTALKYSDSSASAGKFPSPRSSKQCGTATDFPWRWLFSTLVRTRHG